MSKDKIKKILVHSFRRVSSKKQKDEGVSLAVQKKINLIRAKDDSLTVHRDWEIDETAQRDLVKQRKQFDRFFDEISNREYYHIVLCEKLDRLFRNDDDKDAIRRLVRVGRIEIRTERPKDVFDSSAGSFKKLIYNILGDVGTFFSDYLKEERDKAIAEKLERGEFPAQAPLGYKNIPRSKNTPAKIVKDKQAPLVEKFLKIFSTAKYTPVQMVEKAKNLGLKSKHGRVINLPGVKYILRNKFYTGYFDFPHPDDGEVREYKGTNYEPLITRELWERNQQILDRHLVSYSKRTGKPWRYKELLFCHKCGRPLIAEIGKRKGYYSKKKGKEVNYKIQYYRCSGTWQKNSDKKKKEKKCDLAWFTEKEIDSQVLEQIDYLEFDNELWQEIKKNLFEVEGEKIIGYEIKQLRTEETKLDEDLEFLYEDYKQGVVDEKFFTTKQEKVRARQEEIKGRLEELEEEKEFWDEKVGKLVKIIDGIKNFKEKFIQFDEKMRAQMLKLMVKKISANSKRIEVSERDYDRLHKIKRRKDVKQITIVWNDEFEELFELGVIKRLKEWEKEPDDTPRWPSPPKNGGIHPEMLKRCQRPRKNNLLGINKYIDILFSIIYLLCIFYRQSQEETPMIKNDIALNIEKESEFNRSKALQMVETILESLKDALKNDEKIEIRGFASFKVVSKKTGFGRDIRRKKQIKIKEGRRIKFRPGQELKNL